MTPTDARTTPPGAGRDTSFTPAAVTYPSRLSGTLDEPLSRGLWLVKWLLAVPHLIVLTFLWVAVAVTTVIAWFSILFTTQYPRALFDFAVGVVRWSWRVAFYAFAPLGTDRYPPFTLAEADYPATFTVHRQDHYSRGLVLVKSWLLALPHLIIVEIFTSAATRTGSEAGNGALAFSLLGILSLVAGVTLLVTANYPVGLFELIMGVSRWVFRVVTYVWLLRDEYPPFRLDQGGDEPDGASVAPAPLSIDPVTA